MDIFLFPPVMHFKCFVLPPPPSPPLEKRWKLIVKRRGIGNEFSRAHGRAFVFVCVSVAGKINQKLNCCSDGKRSGDYFGGLGFVRSLSE
jgi:hypothetical protein